MYRLYGRPTFDPNDIYGPRENFGSLAHTPVWPHTTYMFGSCGPHSLAQGHVAYINTSHGLAPARVPSSCVSNSKIVSYTTWTHVRVSSICASRSKTVSYMTYHTTMWHRQPYFLASSIASF
ncbi:hypothetical protein PVK06_004130 [Gossypium arboreum]|uniref:Uncharacterized protein n=1 Tax=Gossypium arboreum TaxID=29729 RepID=A0ABR0QSG9_GOSAR|nr:hypothetical protein PVK06_004130 [Gossypium arboreum]